MTEALQDMQADLEARDRVDQAIEARLSEAWGAEGLARDGKLHKGSLLARTLEVMFAREFATVATKNECSWTKFELFGDACPKAPGAGRLPGDRSEMDPIDYEVSIQMAKAVWEIASASFLKSGAQKAIAADGHPGVTLVRGKVLRGNDYVDGVYLTEDLKIQKELLVSVNLIKAVKAVEKAVEETDELVAQAPAVLAEVNTARKQALGRINAKLIPVVAESTVGSDSK